MSKLFFAMGHFYWKGLAKSAPGLEMVKYSETCL